MSNENPTPEQHSLTILGRGCLAGGVLAVGFLAVSGVVFLLLSLLGLPRNLTLLASIVSGPAIGGLGILLFMVSGRQLPFLAPPLTQDSPEDEA